MKASHILMMIGVTAMWGTNFIAIKVSLEHLPPFFQLALRFIFVSIPLIFFVKRPTGDWKLIFKFSLFLWILQLSFINLGLKYGVPAGMFSLLAQSKTAIVLILSVCFYRYYPQRHEISGVMIAFAGIALIVIDLLDQGCDIAYLFIIPAVLSFSAASLVFKNDACQSNPLSVTVWCAFITFFPMALISYYMEGVQEIQNSLQTLTPFAIAGLFYTIVFATLLGTSWYVFLLNRYGPERIVPFNLLVPVFGLIASWIVYDEKLTHAQTIAAILILGGLLINQNPGLFLQSLKRKILRNEILEKKD